MLRVIDRKDHAGVVNESVTNCASTNYDEFQLILRCFVFTLISQSCLLCSFVRKTVA